MKIRIVLVGLMMGAAEVVPGVSGGTIAFISGFYERLVSAIQRFTPLELWSYRRRGMTKLWSELDINFLILLFGGMFCAVVLFANLMAQLIEQYSVLVWAFFFGLVFSSIFVVGSKLVRNLGGSLAIGAGIALGFGLTQLPPFDSEASSLALFAGGSLAVCAWILPGVSGSFILLILGLYQTVILAIRDLNWLILINVAFGCVVGLLAFTRILTFMLNRFHNLTVSLLVGIMIGSLPKLWPWKLTTSYVIGEDGSQLPIVQESVMPTIYAEIQGIDPSLGGAVFACLLGLIIVILLDRSAMLTPGYEDAK